MVQIRTETVADHEAVWQVNREAFDGPAEADLVEAIRHSLHYSRGAVSGRTRSPSSSSFVLDDPSGSPSDSLFDLGDLSSPRTARRRSKSAPCRVPQLNTSRSAPDAPAPRE